MPHLSFTKCLSPEIPLLLPLVVWINLALKISATRCSLFYWTDLLYVCDWDFPLFVSSYNIIIFDFHFAEWNLKPTELDGDSLSYLDMMERSIQEERRRERERQIMDEGKQLWQLKKQEQLETEIKDQEEVGHNSFLKKRFHE